MKNTLVMISLLAGTALAPFASSAADRAWDSSKAFVQDSAIANSVKSRLVAEHVASLAHIHVETQADGLVWLSGTARSQGEIDKAVSIARGTERVMGVRNNLTVRQPI